MIDNSSLGLDPERYKIISELGKGGVGTVYSATDKLLDLNVAIKVLTNVTEESLIRFQQEAKLTAKLKHPRIIEIYDFGVSTNGNPYMVIELLKGISLADLLKRKGCLDEETALPIFKQICEALSHAHKNRVIHRDLKPSNIIVTDHESNDRKVKIIDFGIGKFAAVDQSITDSGYGIGSPLYMSPEQINNNNLDYKTDIYSLGCLLYEVLSGKPPFVGSTAIETINMHLNNDVPDLPNQIQVSENLKATIKSCLSKDKTERPSRVDDLFQEQHESQIAIPIDLDLKEESQYKSKGHLGLIIFSVLLLAIASILLHRLGFLSEEKIQLRPAFINELHETKGEKDSYHLPRTVSLIAYTDQDLRDLDKRYNNLLGLNLQLSKVSGEGLSHLKTLPLVFLNLSDLPIEKNHLKALAHISNLKVLLLDKCQNLNGNFLKPLANLSNLKTISIRGCSLDSTSFKSISEFEALKNIIMRGAHFSSPDCLKPLKGLKLDFLSLAKTNILPDDLKTICESNSIKEIDLNECTRLTTDSLNDLVNLDGLETLAITPDKNNNCFEAVSKLKGLKHLKIFNGYLTQGATIAIPDNLKTLSAYNSQFTSNSGLSKALSKSGVSTLNLNNCQISEEILKSLREIPSLKTINLPYSNFDFKNCFKSWKGINLKALDLSYTTITNEDLNVLSRSIECEKLTIKNCLSLTPDSILSLNKVKGLRSLVVNPMPQRMRFYKSIAQLKHLKKLQLISGDTEGDVDYSKMKSLNSLSIALVETEEEILKNVCQIPNLKKLEFKVSAINKKFPEILKNSKINDLVFNGCSFTSRNANYLGLKNMKTLKMLRLIDTPLSEKENANLQELTKLRPDLKILISDSNIFSDDIIARNYSEKLKSELNKKQLF